MTQYHDDSRGQSWFIRQEVERIALNWFLWGFGIGATVAGAVGYLIVWLVR